MAERDDAGAGFLKCFGKQMKLFRELAGLTQAELAKRLNYGEDQVSSVEQGRRIPKPAFIDMVDEVLNAHGVLKAMKDEVAQVRYPAFFRDAARLEAEAVECHAYDCQVINGLLQTEEYARAVFTMRRPLLAEETIEQRVTARLARQEIFSRWPAPLMSFVIEEVLLRRPIGGESVLRGQLEQLLLIGQKRNVEIQVMPTDREDHAGLGGHLILMETAGHQRVAYVEVANVSRLLTERKMVRELEAQYGIIRAQALTPQESMTFIEKLLGEA
ncbi:Scr1 family TA system antitoxin-like transcriptional regulator [Streptantibioticus rubrisoli]|uniref:Helix-turn-helix transcriptional regulator n=1 Tax=Streptantibioticus rubrisoli TaxID=1387313 RepID=A0ABT1PAU9_9ACTN|nr:helix-turn-helix transcriptional regulator [Streptantibioticus rubrisoli]MCQ4042499.1 helix-turn-helix transcriptional regulator [Streptantibioticus rubrisoli]